MKNEFLTRIREIIEDNISNEQFGVSDLASRVGMSRSNLLRKIKKLTGVSASRYISQVRLERAMEMLTREDFTVSEVGFKVGFNSTSYFIRCFREHFGYPPGEMGRRQEQEVAVKDEGGRVHKLAAIMFTDIQGYTLLMQQDEKKAVEIRNRHREIFNTITKKYNGHILQYYGDGTLSTFNSAIDAVRCGIDLQLAFRHDAKIPVRIGIHTGDIIFSDDDIIGDGVNIASRIESLAIEGSIYISGKVYDEVKNQSGIHTQRVGKFDLKNVGKAVEVFAISNSGLAVPGKKRKWIRGAAALVLLAFIAYILFGTGIFNGIDQVLSFKDQSSDKKSIAVLPFINDSDDSTNIYFINGLMESTLNNLQKIKDIRVISRTSVEKYRKNPKPVSEIAQELGVDYIVEGSGQKNEGQIFLHIQLIEAETDRHLMSEQYIRDWTDIFQLQLDIAGQIADKIEIVLSPEEKEQIHKTYTDDPEAYDLFMKGIYSLNKGTAEGLFEGISWLQKAVDQDPGYARAYAAIGIAYYYADFFSIEKLYVDSVNYYADLALFHDPTLAQGMLAKAMFYLHTGERELALPFLEKALEYNPNAALILNMLSDYYTTIEPNTEKYLEYAIRGLSLDPAPEDSMQTSIAYLHIANAFVQSGFVDEARKYVDRSMMFDPGNVFSMYVKEYINFAREKDIDRLCQGLVGVLRKDSTRLDVLQETAKCYFYAGDYESSYRYYRVLADTRKDYNIDMYTYENAKIGFIYNEMGLEKEADSLMAIAKAVFDRDQSIYRNLSLAGYYAYYNRTDDALAHLKLFSEEDNYFYWVVLFIDLEPMFDNIKELPEYQRLVKEIKAKFWQYHERMRTTLLERGVL